MKAAWLWYDYVFYSNHTRQERKQLIRDLINKCGWSAYDAISDVRHYEYLAEHGPSD